MQEGLKREERLHFPRSAKMQGLPLSRKEIAAIGEMIAGRWLCQRGHTLLERNWRLGRFGEIDLILRRRDGLIVFAEVKTRRQWLTEAGFVDLGFDSISYHKRRKILLTAQSYIARQKIQNAHCQCDAVLVTYESAFYIGSEAILHGTQVLHIAGAFTGA